MGSFNPQFTCAAFAVCLFFTAAAMDLSEFSCPDSCATSRREVENDCIKYGIIGCAPRECRTESGRRGFECTMPTPVPIACPAVCKDSRVTVGRECRSFHFLRCAVENCEIPDPEGGIPSRGFSCADPTPTPTACTDTCRGTRREAATECRKLVLLGCSVHSCINEIEGSPAKLGFSCSTPTPTPTACPDVCMEYEVMTREQCKAVAGLGLGCRVQRCAGGRGFICGTTLPPPDACPDICTERKGPARNACRRLPASLGCEVQQCDRGFGRKKYTCATPSPTPTACPGVCYGESSIAVEECTAVRALGLDCTVEKCVGPEGSGFSCGTPVLVPDAVITIDDVPLDETFKFTLNLEVTEGAGVSKEDLYLLTDATGSMGGQIAMVRSRFMDIVSARTGVSTDVQFGVGFYRDEADGFDNGFSNVQSVTDDLADVQSAINSLSAAAGGDSPEANLVALYRLATDSSIGWRSGTRRIVVMMGDNPGHEPTCISGAPDLTRAVVADALKAEGITVVAVSFTPGLDGSPSMRGCTGATPAGTGQATFIATETGGTLVSATTADLITTIMDTVGSLSLTFDVDTSDCDDVLTSTYDPSFPIEVEAGTSTSVCQVIALKPGVCDAGSSFECEIKYSTSGADTGSLIVRTSNISGC